MPEKSEHDLSDFFRWAFQTAVLGIGVWGASELSTLSKSIQELNIKMAVVVERDQARGEEIRDIKLRVQTLEEQRETGRN